MIWTGFRDESRQLLVARPSSSLPATVEISSISQPVPFDLTTDASLIGHHLINKSHKYAHKYANFDQHLIHLSGGGDVEQQHPWRRVSRSLIDQVCVSRFDHEYGYFFDRSSTPRSPTIQSTAAATPKQAARRGEQHDMFMAVGYSSSRLSSYALDTSTGSASLASKLLYDIDFDREKIAAIATSDFIRGETAVLTARSGHMYIAMPEVIGYSKVVA